MSPTRCTMRLQSITGGRVWGLRAFRPRRSKVITLGRNKKYIKRLNIGKGLVRARSSHAKMEKTSMNEKQSAVQT
jgi:hypothetical protein